MPSGEWILPANFDALNYEISSDLRPKTVPRDLLMVFRTSARNERLPQEPDSLDGQSALHSGSQACVDEVVRDLVAVGRARPEVTPDDFLYA
jgi:hypothetical protein